MKKVTKKSLLKAEEICNKFGYWSEEVLNFISQWSEYSQRLKIHNHLNKLR